MPETEVEAEDRLELGVVVNFTEAKQTFFSLL